VIFHALSVREKHSATIANTMVAMVLASVLVMSALQLLIVNSSRVKRMKKNIAMHMKE
jgi:hypothetical protein